MYPHTSLPTATAIHMPQVGFARLLQESVRPFPKRRILPREAQYILVVDREFPETRGNITSGTL
jgi:hypothetical protein